MQDEKQRQPIVRRPEPNEPRQPRSREEAWKLDHELREVGVRVRREGERGRIF